MLRTDHDARRGIVVWPRGADVGKPVLIVFLQSLEDLGTLGGEVVLLARILADIVEFQLGLFNGLIVDSLIIRNVISGDVVNFIGNELWQMTN